MSANQFFIAPLKSDGSNPAAATAKDTYTLASGTTYYIPFQAFEQRLSSIQMKWDASIILTSVTLEGSNMGEYTTYQSTTAGDWVPEAPVAGNVNVTGAGASVTAGVIAVAGGTAGGGMFHAVDRGSARQRLKVVVAGTGGVVQFAGCHKGM
jgi:hypothetical protein